MDLRQRDVAAAQRATLQSCNASTRWQPDPSEMWRGTLRAMIPLTVATTAQGISKAWIGLGLGLLMGLCDLAVLHFVGIEMRHGELNMMLPVMTVFAGTFGALGYANGRLSEARAQIHAQLQELEQTHEQMLHYEKLASIGRMAAGVAHEVRNPLGVIKSSAALLVDCVDPAEADAIAAGRFIDAEINRLDGFIKSLLDFSRPLSPSRRTVDQGELAGRVRDLCRTTTEGVDFEVAQSGGPWEIDVDLIARAATTLVVNACQAAGQGGRVRVNIGDARDALEVTVCDDGPGIDASAADNLFEPFVTTKAKGTGLGLPMAQRIVEAHHGAITTVTKAGLGPDARGACFRIVVPAARVARERAA